MELRVKRAPRIDTEITVPGDKSISHRAAIIAALSNGVCTLRGFLHERIIKTVPAQPCSQFRDIDTPQDYERLLEEAGFGRN